MVVRSLRGPRLRQAANPAVWRWTSAVCALAANFVLLYAARSANRSTYVLSSSERPCWRRHGRTQRCLRQAKGGEAEILPGLEVPRAPQQLSPADIRSMQSAEDVLEAVERQLSLGLSGAQSRAALTTIADLPISRAVSKSPVMERLLGFHGQLIRGMGDWVRPVSDTLAACQKLKGKVPGIRQLELTATEVSIGKMLGLRPLELIYLVRCEQLQSRKAMEQVAVAVRRKMTMYSPPLLSNISLAFAKARYRDVNLLLDLGDSFVRKIQLALPLHVSTMVNCFFRLDVRHDELVKATARYAATDVGRFKGSEIAHMLIGHLGLGGQDKAFLSAVSNFAKWNVRRLNPWSLSTMAYGLARHEQGDRTFFAGAAKAFLAYTDMFRPSDVVRVLEALRISSAANEPTVQEAMQVADDKLRDLVDASAQDDLKAIVSTAGDVNFQDKDLLNIIAKKLAVQLDDFPAEVVVLFAFKFSYLKIQSIFKAIGEYTLKNINAFGAVGLGNVLRAFAEVGQKDEAVLEAIASWAKQNEKKLRPRLLSLISLEYDMFGYQDEELMEVVSRAALAQLTDFTLEELASLLQGHEMEGFSPVLTEEIISQALGQAPELQGELWTTMMNAATSAEVDLGAILQHRAVDLQKAIESNSLPPEGLQGLFAMLETLPPEDQPPGLLYAVRSVVP